MDWFGGDNSLSKDSWFGQASDWYHSDEGKAVRGQLGKELGKQATAMIKERNQPANNTQVQEYQNAEQQVPVDKNTQFHLLGMSTNQLYIISGGAILGLFLLFKK